MDAISSSLWSRVSRLLLGIVIVSAAWNSLPPMVVWLRRARELRPLPYAQRREHMLGPYYAQLKHAKRELRDGEAVALVMRRWQDMDAGVFGNYYLYPRHIRLYYGSAHYRGDFVPGRPATLLRIDMQRDDRIRRMTYEEIRAEEMGETRIVRHARPALPALREFLVPLVAAVDGAPPDVYVTEAVMMSEVDAEVTLTFEPSHATKKLTLHANKAVAFIDLVNHAFDVLGTGWLRVSSTAPLRASFWFVNRGRGQFVEVPRLTSVPPLPQRVRGGEKLWIVNVSDAAANIRVDGTPHTIPPRGVVQFPAEGRTSVIEGEAQVLAFMTRKTPKGNTELRWPQ